MKHSKASAVSTTLALALGTSAFDGHNAAFGQCVGQEFGTFNDIPDRRTWRYGSALDVAGGIAVIAQAETTESLGAVYVFAVQPTAPYSWEYFTTLRPSDAHTGDGFAATVATDGVTIVVGAPDYSDQAVYVYRNTGGQIQETKLTPSDAPANALFGSAVLVEGDTLVVGATYDDQAGEWDAGAAYVFKFDGVLWNEAAKLLPSVPQEKGGFGGALALDGDLLLIGAPGYGYTSPSGPGAAFVFRHDGNNWVEEARFETGDTWIANSFGMSVAVKDDLLVIGSGRPELGSPQRVAYVYRYDGSDWVPQPRMTAAGMVGMGGFGGWVDVADDTIFVSGPSPEKNLPDGAYLYLFDADPELAATRPDWDMDLTTQGWPGIWQDRQRIPIPVPIQYDWWGHAFAVDGKTALASTFQNDYWTPEYPDPGSVVLFNIADDCNSNGVQDSCDIAQGIDRDCNRNGTLDSCDLSQGVSIDSDGTGVPDECEDCNTNGVLDSQDIAAGFSRDCDANVVPDACQIANGSSPDCDNNDVPDECDIASGAALDDDADGVPDHCVYDCAGRESLTLYPPSAPEDTNFGRAIDASEDTAVIGSAYYSGPYFAQIIRFDGQAWKQEAYLTSTDSDESFGEAVAIHGDVAVVGAPDTDVFGGFPGTVYVYRRYGLSWVLEQAVTSSDGVARDYVGTSVAVRDSILVAGAIGTDGAEVNSGVVYVFDFDGSNWQETAKLFPADGKTYDAFGTSVALDPGPPARLLVGASAHDAYGEDAGAAYVYRRDGSQWELERKLVGSDTKNWDNFGYAVAISGERILIGAPQQSPSGPRPGAVYVFEYDPASPDIWVERARLVPSDGLEHDAFGASAAMFGDTVVVGAHWATGSGVYRAGAAYVYNFNGLGWHEQVKLVSSDPSSVDQLGLAVAAGDGWVLAGAPFHSPDGLTTTGAVYHFNIWNDANSNGVRDICDLPAVVVGAASTVHHAGTPLSFDLFDNPIEPRIGGPEQFDVVCSGPVANVLAHVTCQNAMYTGATVVNVSDNRVAVGLSESLPDVDCCEVVLSGDAEGSFFVQTLAGDVDRNGIVTTADASIIKPLINHQAANAGPQFDLDASGTVTTGDFAQVKPRFNNTADCSSESAQPVQTPSEKPDRIANGAGND